MNRPSRDTAAGRAYLDLQRRARIEGRPTDELLLLYILERFLFRLPQSPHRSRLILKGGMLLAAFGDRRPTGDVDLLARDLDNKIETVSRIVTEILEIRVDDGVIFDTDRIRTDAIRASTSTAACALSCPPAWPGPGILCVST